MQLRVVGTLGTAAKVLRLGGDRVGCCWRQLGAEGRGPLAVGNPASLAGEHWDPWAAEAVQRFTLAEGRSQDLRLGFLMPKPTSPACTVWAASPAQ